ncbi:MAG TPA: PEP/pyruvate-binding domain-containing protein, partial [Flavisolibacter sp.]|nr:PEP/pyruvate-binding domain-containing protein [Flavisolibacter sp.]
MPGLTTKFKDIRLTDLPEVGGKNASLGEMFNQLQEKGIRIPDGFATTAKAFWLFLDENSLRQPLEKLMATLDKKMFSNLKETGSAARNLILQAVLPEELKTAILSEFRLLNRKENAAFAVRSSATAEDLPQASFAGQHESFLNIQGE